MTKKARGFTLLELMIVVAIITILAGLAFSAYQKQVRKARRAEAKQVLSDLTLKQEKWRSNHSTYGTVAEVGGAGTSSYYTFALTTGSNTATGYVMTAAPAGDQVKDKCGTLTVTMASGSLTKCPGASTCSDTQQGCW
jgi:type IV pilus assembly protein PilE